MKLGGFMWEARFMRKISIEKLLMIRAIPVACLCAPLVAE
jgi:hypothetical protein